jgi:hypothetical protein
MRATRLSEYYCWFSTIAIEEGRAVTSLGFQYNLADSNGAIEYRWIGTRLYKVRV